MPSYHDLHITAPNLTRTSIFNLPYGYEVTCNRVAGWELWFSGMLTMQTQLIGGEYADGDRWLILDVDGVEIVNSRDKADDDD